MKNYFKSLFCSVVTELLREKDWETTKISRIKSLIYRRFHLMKGDATKTKSTIQ